MKIVRTIHLIIALTLIAHTYNSFGMNIVTKIAQGTTNGLCSTAELLLTCMPLINSYIFNPADLRAEKLKNVQSNAPEPITHLFTKIAQSKGINDVVVILNDDAHDYCTNDNGNIILIPNKKAEELKKLLTQSTLTGEEQEKLNEEIGTVHHELTHGTMRSLKYVPMYDAVIGTVGAVATSATLTQLTHKYFPAIQKNFILHNAFKLGRGALTFSVAFNLINMNLYKKYDELKADDGIPNQRDLLESQVKKFKKRHDDYLHCIDIIKERASFGDIISPPEDNQFTRPQLLAMKTIPKSLFDEPIVMDTVFHAGKEHPSDLRRALRFEQRINAL